jgi:hypothetical protein
MVTTVSIRLALGKLAEVACGTRPRLIRVTARIDESRRIYSAAIPWEYRDEVCSFLSERLDTEIHMQGSLLTLTEAQAGAVLALAFRIDAGPTVNPIEAGDEASEAEQINTRS